MLHKVISFCLQVKRGETRIDLSPIAKSNFSHCSIFSGDDGNIFHFRSIMFIS